MARTPAMELNLSEVLQQVAREKDIDFDRWISALEDAMASAAKKQHRIKAPVRSTFDPESGKFDAFIVKTVAEEIEDPQAQWTLEEAQDHKADAEIGDEIHIPISTEGLGRIAAQSAKQVLYQRIREAEREKIYNEFIDREGEVVNGTVKRFERGDIIVDLGRTEAIVPRSEQARHERYSQGERIRAVIIEVHQQPKGPQVVLSRTDPRLLVKLFEMEVPEIYDGTVQIKAAVRAPGERAKVAVISRERDVDPVGACVGMKGSRVQSIIRELRGEKIDIIEFSDDLVTFAQSALAPARITRVSVTHHGEIPHLDVIVEDEQLSLAIGKRGQNVRLASELLASKIDIKSETDVKDEVAGALARMLQTAMSDEGEMPETGPFDITLAPGVGAKTGEKLKESGFLTRENVLELGVAALEKVEGVGPKTARAIYAWAEAMETAPTDTQPSADEAGPTSPEPEEDMASALAHEGDDFMAALGRALEEAEMREGPEDDESAAVESQAEAVTAPAPEDDAEPSPKMSEEPSAENQVTEEPKSEGESS